MASMTSVSLINLLTNSTRLVKPHHLNLQFTYIKVPPQLHNANKLTSTGIFTWRSLASSQPPPEFPQRRIKEVDPTTPQEMPELPRDPPQIDPSPPEFIIPTPPGEIGPPPPPYPRPNPSGPDFPHPPIPSPPGPDVVPPPEPPRQPPDVIPPTTTPPPDILPPTGPIIV